MSLRVVAVVGLVGLLALGWRAPARAVLNDATYRDCSIIVPGVDPDFVRLTRVTINSDGSVGVPASARSVVVEASESSDPGDSSGKVKLTATISSPGLPKRTVTGGATGQVELDVPLVGSSPGRTYTIDWAAVFDSGQHPCPSPMFSPLVNPSPMPFTVKVSK